MISDCAGGRVVFMMPLQIELEKSHYSDHEIRKLEEEEQLRRRKEGLHDDEDEELGRTVVMAQDLEEKWEQKLLQFSPAPRITGTCGSVVLQSSARHS